MSWMEVLVIVFVFLLVLGPKEILPTLLLIARLFKKIYKTTHFIKEEINSLIHEAEAQDYSEKSRKLAHEKEPLIEAEWEPPRPLPPQKASRRKASS